MRAWPTCLCALLLCAACESAQEPPNVRIGFSATVDGAPLQCGQVYDNLGTPAGSFRPDLL